MKITDSVISVKTKTSQILVCQFFVAGFVFHEFAAAQRVLKEGMKLSLVREDNPHDPNAIAVLIKHRKKTLHIGYVPREQTYQIRGFKGIVKHAIVQAYAPTNATHRMILVDVYGIKTEQLMSATICGF